MKKEELYPYTAASFISPLLGEPGPVSYKMNFEVEIEYFDLILTEAEKMVRGPVFFALDDNLFEEGEKKIASKLYSKNLSVKILDVKTEKQNVPGYGEMNDATEHLEKHIEMVITNAVKYLFTEGRLMNYFQRGNAFLRKDIRKNSETFIKCISKHVNREIKERLGYRAGIQPTRQKASFGDIQIVFLRKFVEVFQELNAEGKLYKKDGTLHKGRIAGRLFPDAYDNLTRKFNNKLKELNLTIDDLIEYGSFNGDEIQEFLYDKSDEN